ERGWLRITGLTRTVGELMAELAAGPPAKLTLQRRDLAVCDATLGPAAHPWAGCMTYQELAPPFWLQANRNLTATVVVYCGTTPTLSSSGQNGPLRIPRWVFESLLNRRQAFAPIELYSAMERVIAEQVVVKRVDIRRRGVPSM